MKNLERLTSLLVSDEPRRSADKLLEFLVAHTRAKTGAVIAVDEDRPSIFVSRGLGLDALPAVRSIWTAQRSALMAGRAVGDRYVLVPVLEGSELVALLYLESPRELDLEGIRVFCLSLAQAVRAARRAAPPVEVYLSSARSEDLERQRLVLVLDASEWNIAQAARVLGVTRRTVYERLRRLGLKRKRVRKALRGRETPA